MRLSDQKKCTTTQQAARAPRSYHPTTTEPHAMAKKGPKRPTQHDFFILDLPWRPGSGGYCWCSMAGPWATGVSCAHHPHADGGSMAIVNVLPHAVGTGLGLHDLHA